MPHSVITMIFYCFLTYAQIAVGFMSANRCLKPIENKRAAGYAMFAVILLLNAAVYILRFNTEAFAFLNIAALYVVPFCVMNEGPFPHKAFIYVTQYYVPISLYMIASFVSEIFFVYETVPYLILTTTITLCVYMVYFLLHIKYGKQVCDRLFSYTKPGLWSAYLIIPFACLFITGYFYFTGDVKPHKDGQK